ncbi:MAG TPA: prepilin-type N-terminal cleavage/methylation domain-containing protein, partial [Vicinamibacteria bacterium]
MQDRRASNKGELGFSMVELMVAMVVTLVVSGAIFGLLTVGGNAFRREPEVADRQQNIRIAMDAIARDIQNAGSGMPLVSQVFTHTDAPLGGPNPTGFGAPYLNGQGPQGVLGAPGQALRGAPPTGTLADGSDNSDVLEILIGEGSCPVFHVCKTASPLNGSPVSSV